MNLPITNIMTMRKLAFPLFGFLGILLSFYSCGLVTKPYKRPAVDVTNLYRTARPLDSASMAQVSWDRFFKDSVLKKHIKKAITNNYDLRIAAQNLAAAQAQIKAAKGAFFPSLNIGPKITFQNTSQSSQFGTFFRTLEQYELSASASWEIDIWGKLASAKRATVADALRSEALLKALQTGVVADVATYYYQLVALDEQLEIAEQTLVNRKESIEIIEALKTAGTNNELDVLQTHDQLFVVEINIEDLKYNIKVAENALSILLGEAPQDIDRSHLAESPFSVDLKPGIPALLLSNRPDVIAAEMDFRRTFELTNVARASFYPTLSINATGGFQALGRFFYRVLDPVSLFTTVIPGITAPIFNNAKLRANYLSAKAGQQASLLTFQKTLLRAGEEVSNRIAQYEAETQKLSIRSARVETLEKAQEYSDDLLKSGKSDYLQVLTAKDNALSAKLQLADNYFQQRKTLISLYKALGGGY